MAKLNWHHRRQAALAAHSTYRSRIKPQGQVLRCKVCSRATGNILITTGNGPGQPLTTHAFCNRQCATEGGFQWAGQRR